MKKKTHFLVALNNAWNFLLQALPVSVYLFIMYRLFYFTVENTEISKSNQM